MITFYLLLTVCNMELVMQYFVPCSTITKMETYVKCNVCNTHFETGVLDKTVQHSLFMLDEEPNITTKTTSTMELKTIVVLVTKPSKDAKLGIGLTNNKGSVIVTTLFDDGLFANTDLKVGMRVKTINSNRVTTSQQAVCLLKEAEKQVAIVASYITAIPKAVKKAASVAPDNLPSS